MLPVSRLPYRARRPQSGQVTRHVQARVIHKLETGHADKGVRTSAHLARVYESVEIITGTSDDISGTREHRLHSLDGVVYVRSSHVLVCTARRLWPLDRVLRLGGLHRTTMATCLRLRIQTKTLPPLGSDSCGKFHRPL